MSNATDASSEAAADQRDFRPTYPWHFRLLVYLVTGFASMLVWSWFITLRPIRIGPIPTKKSQGLYTTWHRGLLFAIFYFRNYDAGMMASASKDGEWAAGLIERFGNCAIRGSSSRGGRVALRELQAHIEKGRIGGVSADAPRGPAQESKAGMLALAQRARSPIIPFQFAAERCWRLKSWDRTIIPKPFSRIVIYFGDEFHVDPALEGETFDARRKELDATMNALTEKADAYFAQG